MASAEASSSKAAAMSPDELTSLTSSLARHYKTQHTQDDLAKLYLDTKQSQIALQKSRETSLLSQAPSYLKLHGDLNKSKALLGELESFLTVFCTDLNTLSSQMKTLQSRSQQLGSRLENRQALEDKLKVVIEGLTLDPSFVDIIFADDASMAKISLDVWKECAEKLNACIRAVSAFDENLREESRDGDASEVKALQEAKAVTESCRIMAATKIRPILILTFSPLRSSLSTNLPVLQSILLKSYRPLYMFLSNHAPRTAIDVQRSYVAAARLYFETGFRRYERSIAKLRDRERSRTGAATYSSEATTSSSFVEPFRASTIGIGSLLPGGSTGPTTDPWLGDADNLDNAKIFDGPAVTLAYLADDAEYRAPIEALFRSLTLTFLDNASSEYCFLARFFEGVDLDSSNNLSTSSNLQSATSTSSAVKVNKGDAAETDSDGPLPEESASVRGDEEAGEEEARRESDLGTVVAFSDLEKRRLRGRGAINGLWKQVMEPVMGTYNTFVASVLAHPSSLLSLYTMLKLNDNALQEAQIRGSSPVLQSTLMTFKLKAWPVMQKQFDEVLDSVKKLTSEGASTSSYLGSLGSLFGGAGAGTQGSASSKDAQGEVLKVVCHRYARLFSSIVKLNSLGEEDAMIFGNLSRIRTEIERVLSKAEVSMSISCYQAVLSGLEDGPASVSHSRMQSEISHWTEMKRSRTGV